MKHISAILLISTLAACGGGGGGSVTSPSTPGTPGTPGTPATPTVPSSVDNVTFSGLLNNVRANNGASPVAFDARLASAAQGHADDMLAQNYFSHTGLNGSSPGDRITAAGYNWRTYGENIARGQSSETEVLQDWTNSPGHHANDINPSFEDYGLAKAGTGSDARWVLVLGAER